MNTGIFFCMFNQDSNLPLEAIAKYSSNLPDVTVVELLGVKPRLEAASLSGLINSRNLDRIIIAGDMPGYYKAVFTRAMSLAGRNVDEVRLASFSEHGASGQDAMERAKAIVACACLAVPFSLAAIPLNNPVNHATLIIGGGVAGIQAALEIADAGKPVYLVEKTGTIGGHMAMFDKTFPTLDCAACILTPKMVSVVQNDMINLMTNSVVETVTGIPGDYKVKIRHKARYVDIKSCVACGLCSEVCPVEVSSEFDSGTSKRKAIYIPFPQAVPNAYILDGDACHFVQTKGSKCGACQKKCPKECINFADYDHLETIEVGNIILATGYEVMDVRKIEKYGYGKYPNVLTALEFERITNASGVTGGKIVTRSKRFNKKTKADEWVFDPDNPSPKSVAIIHCVGSRDKNYNPYCSRVCCMYSLKFAYLVKEKLPEATCYEYYIDMRAFGKGYEEFVERIKDTGTFVIRGRSITVAMKEGQMLVRGEDIIHDKVIETPVDLVILAAGLVPSQGTEELSNMLQLNLGDDGWFSELDYNGNPTDTERGGIFVAGMCQGPKDIPDTVAQASAVAAGVLRSIITGRGMGHRNTLSLTEIEEKARTIHTY